MADFENLSTEQIFRLLEKNKISLKDIISELPITEFTEIANKPERDYIHKMVKSLLTDKEKKYNAMLILKKIQPIKTKINKIKTVPIKYTDEEKGDIFDSKEIIEVKDFKERIEMILDDINKNIGILHTYF